MAKQGSNTAVMNITGGAQLKRLFEELPRGVAMKFARRALYAAGKPIRDAARAKATTRYGILKRAIIVRTGQGVTDEGPSRKGRGGDPKVYVTIDPAAKFILGVHRSKRGTWSLKARKARAGDHIEDSTAYIRPRTYAHMVEFGTRPHATGHKSQLKDRLNSKRKGTGVQWGRHHPGAKPKPFMRPAFDSASQAAGWIIARRAEELLAEEVSRLHRFTRRAG